MDELDIQDQIPKTGVQQCAHFRMHPHDSHLLEDFLIHSSESSLVSGKSFELSALELDKDMRNTSFLCVYPKKDVLGIQKDVRNR